MTKSLIILTSMTKAFRPDYGAVAVRRTGYYHMDESCIVTIIEVGVCGGGVMPGTSIYGSIMAHTIKSIDLLRDDIVLKCAVPFIALWKLDLNC